jgi:integrase
MTPLFSPKEVMEHRHAKRRRQRKSLVQPSQKDRRKARPKRCPGDRYNSRSLYHAVAYGIRKANRERSLVGLPEIRSWHPNQLRHNAATRLRKEFGLDTTRAVLGHSSPAVTEVYAELDMTKAAEAMERVG